MNKTHFEQYIVTELNQTDLIQIGGGGVLENFTKAIRIVGKTVGYAVGYAAGAIKDFAASGSVEGNETLMNCI
ncbi:MAG: hypothetical protein GX102_10460 [Porphyromonadaceae bacterium]|nr:hypothetical protein [Porphyromonadaceae bacterium]